MLASTNLAWLEDRWCSSQITLPNQSSPRFCPPRLQSDGCCCCCSSLLKALGPHNEKEKIAFLCRGSGFSSFFFLFEPSKRLGYEGWLENLLGNKNYPQATSSLWSEKLVSEELLRCILSRSTETLGEDEVFVFSTTPNTVFENHFEVSLYYNKYSKFK